MAVCRACGGDLGNPCFCKYCDPNLAICVDCQDGDARATNPCRDFHCRQCKVKVCVLKLLECEHPEHSHCKNRMYSYYCIKCINKCDGCDRRFCNACGAKPCPCGKVAPLAKLEEQGEACCACGVRSKTEDMAAFCDSHMCNKCMKGFVQGEIARKRPKLVFTMDFDEFVAKERANRAEVSLPPVQSSEPGGIMAAPAGTPGTAFSFGPPSSTTPADPPAAPPTSRPSANWLGAAAMTKFAAPGGFTPKFNNRPGEF